MATVSIAEPSESNNSSPSCKIGNPLCESCEEDRKNAKENSKLIKHEPCFDIYKKVERCMAESDNQISKCTKVWKEYHMCRKNLRQQEQYARMGLSQAVPK